MKHKVGIIGAGAWGTAIGKVIAEKGLGVQMWSFEKDVADTINNDHENKRYLPGAALPPKLVATTDIREATAGKEFIILAAPSLHLLRTVKDILSVPNIMEGKSLIGVITKGFITTDSGPRLITQVLEDYLPGFYKNNVVYISGPSHAEEVAQGKLTGLISACANGKNSIRFRELLNCPSMMVFASFDTIGVQICAAVKNIIAVAFGILDALKETTAFVGDNTESLLLASGLNEMQILGRTMGSTHPETFTSIAGVGDLDVTCRSQYGRNRRFGRQIILDKILAKYKNIDELIADIPSIGYLPEGVVASRAVAAIAEARNLKLPIVDSVFRILNRELEPIGAVDNLIRAITKSTIESLMERQ